MNLPKTISRWPLYLGIAGMVIVLMSVWFANDLATQLATIERQQIQLASQAMERLNESLENTQELKNRDFTLEMEALETFRSLPSITTSRATGEVLFWEIISEQDTANVQQLVQKWINEGRKPMLVDQQLIYIGESPLLARLRYFPVVLFFLFATFIVAGYIGLSQSRRAEQNRVWVGMAKETAHQLGTPISAILGWVEHMRLMYEQDEEILEISNELEKDVNRLSMVANRFSKIGAEPELTPTNIYAELEKCQSYMQKRAPRKVKFDFPKATDGNLQVAINPLLFDWVIENLLRNALDAMDGKGEISGNVREDTGRVLIDITDTGKGIDAKNIRKVFTPGFTTKQRGWGLGLSLVRRIIHEYHNGRIQVTRSQPGIGTTFTISLPKVA